MLAWNSEGKTSSAKGNGGQTAYSRIVDCDIRALIWSARQKQANVCRSINCKFQSEARAVIFIKNGSPRVAVHKQLITPGNPHLWLQWCKERRQWTTSQWKNVIWSDESSFTMFSTNGRVHVWRQPKEPHNAECLGPTVNCSGGSVMLWAHFPGMVWVQSFPEKARSMPIATSWYWVIIFTQYCSISFLSGGVSSRVTMTPSAEHFLFSHQIWTQSSIYGIFWSDTWDNIFHLHQTGVGWLTVLWKNGATSSCRIPDAGGPDATVHTGHIGCT